MWIQHTCIKGWCRRQHLNWTRQVHPDYRNYMIQVEIFALFIFFYDKLFTILHFLNSNTIFLRWNRQIIFFRWLEFLNFKLISVKDIHRTLYNLIPLWQQKLDELGTGSSVSEWRGLVLPPTGRAVPVMLLQWRNLLRQTANPRLSVTKITFCSGKILQYVVTGTANR